MNPLGHRMLALVAFAPVHDKWTRLHVRWYRRSLPLPCRVVEG